MSLEHKKTNSAAQQQRVPPHDLELVHTPLQRPLWKRDLENNPLAVHKVALIHRNLSLFGGPWNSEMPEQFMAAEYIAADAHVLELGSNIGRNSLVIATLLRDPAQQFVTIECDPSSLAFLQTNRDLNHLQFHIEGSALSARPLTRRGWVTTPVGVKPSDSTTWSDYSIEPVSTITYDALLLKYRIIFDTLVADCEGALYYIVMDTPQLLDTLHTIIVENDYLEPAHRRAVDNVFMAKGFVSVFTRHGGFGAIENESFFQVWQHKDRWGKEKDNKTVGKEKRQQNDLPAEFWV
jgi:FkbM family methyltransferase